MTRDEILDEYEALWRQQMIAPREACALSLDMTLGYQMIWEHALRHWRCPECGERAYSAGGAAIHFFDVHRHRWDWFANKFRDALAQGETA